MKKFLLFAALFVLVTLASGCTCNGGGYGTIMGKVAINRTGQPLQGASVTTFPATSVVTTNLYGWYYIHNVPSGKYKVTATHSQASISIEVKVIADQVTTADMVMWP